MGAGHSDVRVKARFSGEAGGGSGTWQKYLCPLQGIKSYFRERNSCGNQGREVILNLYNKLIQE